MAAPWRGGRVRFARVPLALVLARRGWSWASKTTRWTKEAGTCRSRCTCASAAKFLTSCLARRRGSSSSGATGKHRQARRISKECGQGPYHARSPGSLGNAFQTPGMRSRPLLRTIELHSAPSWVLCRAKANSVAGSVVDMVSELAISGAGSRTRNHDTPLAKHSRHFSDLALCNDYPG